jgi:hypothetical protein
MGFELKIFADEQLGADYIEWLVDVHSIGVRSRFIRMWNYYKNPAEEAVYYRGRDNSGGRCYVQAQEYGLPPRITGLVHSAGADVFSGKRVREVQRKEVVIENDIAWRIIAETDFLFGKPITFVSRAPDSQKQAKIESILKAVFGANGAVGASPARAR